MSCLRSRLLTRRTMASSARSIIKLEMYHSGIFSFLCGVLGWQKWSGIAASPRIVRLVQSSPRPRAQNRGGSLRDRATTSADRRPRRARCAGILIHRRTPWAGAFGGPGIDFERLSAVNNPAFCEAIFRPLFLPGLTFKFVDESIY